MFFFLFFLGKCNWYPSVGVVTARDRKIKSGSKSFEKYVDKNERSA